MWGSRSLDYSPRERISDSLRLHATSPFTRQEEDGAPLFCAYRLQKEPTARTFVPPALEERTTSLDHESGDIRLAVQERWDGTTKPGSGPEVLRTVPAQPAIVAITREARAHT